MCGASMTAGAGAYTFNKNGWAVGLQMTLQPYVEAWDCFGAYNDIIDNCISQVYATGVWVSDGPDSLDWNSPPQQYYWGWYNPQDFAIRIDGAVEKSYAWVDGQMFEAVRRMGRFP